MFSRLDPSRIDDPSRTFTLAQHEAREPGLRHAHRIGPVLRQPVLHLRQGAGDVICKLVDHYRRGTRRRPYPVPNRVIEAGDARLRDRRDLWQ